MSPKERLKRPVLTRTQQIRNWSTLFEAPNDAATPRDSGRGEQPASLNDVVSRSVDVAYRVIDEYMRRGQQVAQRISDRSYDVQAMTSDVQDLAARTAAYASDFAAVWVDLIQRAATDSALSRPAPATGGAKTAAPAPPAGNPAPGHPLTPDASGPSATGVKIEVASTVPTEVTLDLRPEATGAALSVHALRAVDPDKPRLTDVGYRSGCDGEPPRLWIRVPPDQPPGVYNAVIVDVESSRPVGTLSVRIHAPETRTR